MISASIKRSVLLVGACALALLASCGTPATGPASTAGSTSSSAQANAQSDWDRLVAAAKHEGKLVISSLPDDAYRTPLSAFEAEYPEIKVEYNGLTSPNYWAKVVQERQAGQYLWDLRVGGPDPQVFQARDRGWLEPIRDQLVLPEVTDGSKWLGGEDGLFSDKDQKVIVSFFAAESLTQFVNRDLLPQETLPSSKQLLAPQFRGKVAMGDPRGGPGLGQMTLLLAGYGEQYVSDLLSKQAVTPTTDIRQLAEWLVRGNYAVALGLPRYNLDTFQREGLGQNVKSLAGPLGITNAGGGIQLMNRAPHPNAAKLYVNWLLSQRTQAALAKSTLFNSRRFDTPPGDPAAVVDLSRLGDYIEYQSERWLPARNRAEELARQLLPS